MKMGSMLRCGMVISLVAAGLGCATGGEISDEEQIMALLGKWEAAIVDVDRDDILALYSENFSHDDYDYSAEDKEALAAFLEESEEAGNFDAVEIDMEDIDIEIDGEQAIVYPIDYTNYFGTVTMEMVLTKEKGGWLITDMMIEGL